MGDCPIQPQFDLVGAAKTTAVAVALVAQNINRLQKICYREDVQPLVIPPLERLGGWLMVDPERLEQGDVALSNRPKPKLLSLASVSFIIGLSAEPGDSLVTVISRNTSLIASYLLLGACAVCFPRSDDSAKILHEIMRLNGTLHDYPIPASLVRQFAEAVGGYHDPKERETVAGLYTTLCVKIHQIVSDSPPDAGLHFLHVRMTDLKELATIIYEVVEKMKDADVEVIELRGTRQGIFLACLFIWLRPNEVEVQAWGKPVYPDHFPTYLSSRKSAAKLVIRLGPIYDPKSKSQHFDTWQIQAWKGGTDHLPVIVNIAETDDIDLGGSGVGIPQSLAPISSAKSMMLAAGHSEATVTAIGVLASTFVTVCTDRGVLLNMSGSSSNRLRFLCSENFAAHYTTVVSNFGWTELLDEQHKSRCSRTLGALLSTLDDGVYANDPRNPQYLLERVVSAASLSYLQEHHEHMLYKPETDDDDLMVQILENAVHVAGEALHLAFCGEIPVAARFQCLSHVAYKLHIDTVWCLLRGVGISFWDLRQRGIHAFVPTHDGLKPDDYAVERNGWVFYTGALANWTSCLTIPRQVTTFYIAPGPLKSPDVEGRLTRVSGEHSFDGSLARFAAKDSGSDDLQILKDGVCVVDEHKAADTRNAEICHLWRTDNMGNLDILYLTTYITTYINDVSSARKRSVGSKLVAHWEQSIDAVAFAHHVTVAKRRGFSELAAMEKRWISEGDITPDTRWLPVGSVEWTATGEHISTTSKDEQLRFLQAGIAKDQFKGILVRHQGVPLVECMHEAIEWRKRYMEHAIRYKLPDPDIAGWIIIA